MKCESWASLLARTFVSPCLGRKPKVRVATTFYELLIKVIAKPQQILYAIPGRWA